jgi:hypothetical protein
MLTVGNLEINIFKVDNFGRRHFDGRQFGSWHFQVRHFQKTTFWRSAIWKSAKRCGTLESVDRRRCTGAFFFLKSLAKVCFHGLHAEQKLREKSVNFACSVTRCFCEGVSPKLPKT